MAKKATASKGAIQVEVDGSSIKLSRWPENEKEKEEVNKKIADAKK